MTPHLTHEQLCDLLLSNRAADARLLDARLFDSDQLDTSREHVRDCHICAGELSLLDDSLLLFRSTADAWANHEWNRQSLLQSTRLKPVPARGLSAIFSRPVVWATAAAAALAVAVPFSLHQMNGRDGQKNAGVTVTAPHTTAQAQSDEALLEEVSQTVSYSVPAPMQPLADSTASQISNTQRED